MWLLILDGIEVNPRWYKRDPWKKSRTYNWIHYNDVIMGAIASQITSLTIVYSTVYSDADQRKHQSSASLAFVRGIHRGPVNSQHKWPVTRKMFPFDDVIMKWWRVVSYPGTPFLWRFEMASIINTIAPKSLAPTPLAWESCCYNMKSDN